MRITIDTDDMKPRNALMLLTTLHAAAILALVTMPPLWWIPLGPLFVFSVLRFGRHWRTAWLKLTIVPWIVLVCSMIERIAPVAQIK